MENEDIIIENKSDYVEYMVCPFCKDTDFDMVGLKIHLLSGYCEIFDLVETPQRKG